MVKRSQEKTSAHCTFGLEYPLHVWLHKMVSDVELTNGDSNNARPTATAVVGSARSVT